MVHCVESLQKIEENSSSEATFIKTLVCCLLNERGQLRLKVEGGKQIDLE